MASRLALTKFPEKKPDPASPWADDVLDRESFARFLTALVESSTTPLCINLNSQWGTGKTFFLERWAEDLRKKHPVVYFNAWEADHRADPLGALLAELNIQLSQVSTIDEGMRKTLRERSKTLLKVGVPLLIKLAARLGLGLAIPDDANKLFTGDMQDDLTSALGDFSEKVMDDYESEKSAIESLKNLLSSLFKITQKAEESNTVGPLIFIVDELDRCRPTFALEVLERIKHVFNTSGVIFLIATDTEQLCHSIRGVMAKVLIRKHTSVGFSTITFNCHCRKQVLSCSF